MRYAISDETWAVLGPMVEECKSPLGPAPTLPDRMSFEAVLYWARTGCPWRDLPARLGPWDAVYQRFRRWKVNGVWRALFDRLPGALDLVEALFVDSTIIRAHPHAAGAPGKKGGRRPRPSAAVAAGSAPRSTSPRRTSGRPSPCT